MFTLMTDLFDNDDWSVYSYFCQPCPNIMQYILI